MTDQLPRKRKAPEWLVSSNGKKKQLSLSRWNMERVAEIFTNEPDVSFDMGQLARLIYGHNGKTNRDNTRKHIPLQRNYMMARLLPIITQYGPRGVIESVKLYDRTALNDRRNLYAELNRLRLRKELSEERYDALSEVLGVGDDPTF